MAFASQFRTFVSSAPFSLESGVVLPRLELAYHTIGNLDSDCSNVIWVCHALTGNSDPTQWWKGLVGEGSLFDPERYYVVCANMLGSCYGSSGPLSINAKTNEPYYSSFPIATVRDTVRALKLLREHLGIKQIRLCLGGSMGGQQALEWAIEEADIIESIVPISTNARHSPWGIGFNEAQRLAIEADPTWRDHRADAGAAGLKAARSIGMLTYRNYESLGITQHETSSSLDNYRAASYLQYQGDKLVKRFNAYAYWLLTKAMDSHNVGRARGSVESALRTIRARTLVIGVSSDVLFPTSEQRFIAAHVPGAIYREIDSPYGHDGFLVEFDTLSQLIQEFLGATTKVPVR